MAALEDFVTWDFNIRCASCREQKLLPVADLSQCFGRLLVRDVSGRLRCIVPRCGDRRASPALGSYVINLIGLVAYG